MRLGIACFTIRSNGTANVNYIRTRFLSPVFPHVNLSVYYCEVEQLATKPFFVVSSDVNWRMTLWLCTFPKGRIQKIYSGMAL